MGTGWNRIDVLVPLGRLLCERPEAVQELVVEETRQLPRLSFRRLTGLGGVRPSKGSSGMFRAIRLRFEADTRNAVANEVALCPHVNLELEGGRFQFERAGVQKWQAAPREKCPPPVMQIESTPGLRRIWTRELLTLGKPDFDRRKLANLQALRNNSQGRQDADLVPSVDFRPGSARLPRLRAGRPRTLAGIRREDLRRVPDTAYARPQLIDPNVQVHFDLQPLETTSKRVVR